MESEFSWSKYAWLLWGLDLGTIAHIESKEELVRFLIDWKSTKDWEAFCSDQMLAEDADVFWQALVESREQSNEVAA